MSRIGMAGSDEVQIVVEGSDPDVHARPSGRGARGREGRQLAFMLAICVLLAVIGGSAWAMVRLLSQIEESPPEPRPRAQVTELAQPQPDVAPEQPREPSIDEVPPARGLTADALLRTEIQRLTDDGALADVALGAGIEAGAVTLVNLWATYCEPCKAELPGLQAMFAAARWADQVRFVPLLVADPREPTWVRAQHGPSMPPTRHFLSDPRGRGGTLDLLRALTRMARERRAPDELELPRTPDEVDLPITLVFDCRRDVRLFHVGKLHPADFENLRGLLERLRGELGTGFCAVRRKPPERPREVKPPPEPRCGNGVCEHATEHAETCCDCLTCVPGDMCMHPAGKEPRCVPRSFG